MQLKEPKEVLFSDEKEGISQKFIISKFDCITGLDIMSSIPSLTQSLFLQKKQLVHDVLFTAMKFVEIVKSDGSKVRLETETLVKCHVDHWYMLIWVLKEIMEYNIENFPIASVFEQGISKALDTLAPHMKTLMDSLQQFLKSDKQPLQN